MIACGNRAHTTYDYVREQARHLDGTYHHVNAAIVRACFEATRAGNAPFDTIEDEIREEEDRWTYESEMAAERAANNYWENRGEGFAVDGLYQDEVDRGVIPFHIAMADAERAAGINTL